MRSPAGPRRPEKPRTAPRCRTRAAVPRPDPPRSRGPAGRRRPFRNREHAPGHGRRRGRGPPVGRTPGGDRTAADRRSWGLARTEALARTGPPGRTAPGRTAARPDTDQAADRGRPGKSRARRRWPQGSQAGRSQAGRPQPGRSRGLPGRGRTSPPRGARVRPAGRRRTGHPFPRPGAGRRPGCPARSPTWAAGPRPCPGGTAKSAGARPDVCRRNPPEPRARPAPGPGPGRARRDMFRRRTGHPRTRPPRRIPRPRAGHPAVGPAGTGSWPGPQEHVPSRHAIRGSRDPSGHEDPFSPGGDGVRTHSPTIALPGLQPQAKSAGPPGEDGHLE